MTCYVPLIVGTQRVEIRAGLNIAQQYTPIGGPALKRAQNGRLIGRPHWRGISTTVTASGWAVPPPLWDVDFDQPFDLYCVWPMMRTVPLGTRSRTLPTTHRTDAPPLGYAIDANGRHVATPVALAGSVVTLDAVAGATAYEVGYWPVLACMGGWIDQNDDGRTVRWTLTAEATTSLAGGSGVAPGALGAAP